MREDRRKKKQLEEIGEKSKEASKTLLEVEDRPYTYATPAPKKEVKDAYVPDFDIEDVPPLE